MTCSGWPISSWNVEFNLSKDLGMVFDPMVDGHMTYDIWHTWNHYIWHMIYDDIYIYVCMYVYIGGLLVQVYKGKGEKSACTSFRWLLVSSHLVRPCAEPWERTRQMCSSTTSRRSKSAADVPCRLPMEYKSVSTSSQECRCTLPRLQGGVLLHSTAHLYGWAGHWGRGIFHCKASNATWCLHAGPAPHQHLPIASEVATLPTDDSMCPSSLWVSWPCLDGRPSGVRPGWITRPSRAQGSPCDWTTPWAVHGALHVS